LFVIHLVQNPSPRSFPNMVGRVSGSAKRAGFVAIIHREKVPDHYVQVRRSLISIFFEISSLLGLLNFKRQNRQDRACRIELADLGLYFLL